MKKNKYYYLVEPLDIDGDKNSDGFLISQYYITRNNHKIFTQNKYLTFKDFNIYVKNFKHKSLLKFKGGQLQPQQQQQQQVVVMTPQEYNLYMNNKNQQIQQQPPHVIVNGNQPSFGNSFVSGLGSGVGVGIGFSVTDSIMDSIFG